MEILKKIIILFCPSLISIRIYHKQMKREKWSVDDLTVYGIFVLLNFLVTDYVMYLIQFFTGLDFSENDIRYGEIAVLAAVALAYARVIITIVFHGKVEIEKK